MDWNPVFRNDLGQQIPDVPPLDSGLVEGLKLSLQLLAVKGLILANVDEIILRFTHPFPRQQEPQVFGSR